MKTKLLLLFGLTFTLGFAQQPIDDFTDNVSGSYAVVTANPEIDQTASGANLTWNFTNLTQTSTNTDTYNLNPTAGEIADFPGTTYIATITPQSGTPNNLFLKNDTDEISITGVNGDGTNLNYVTNNATIGTFPMSYGATNSDTSAGNFDGSADGQNVNGSFTGTINSEVDAHGTLNLNDFGLGSYSGNVTRLKVVQVLNLSIVIIVPTNIGTITQTSYYYYDDNDGRLVFRSSTNIVDIFINNPFGDNVDIDQTIITHEALDRTTLSNTNFNLVENTKVLPNPVQDVLNIELPSNISVKNISVSDINGRIVLNSTNTNPNVSQLQSGLYVVTITSDKGIFNKKFIKK